MKRLLIPIVLGAALLGSGCFFFSVSDGTFRVGQDIPPGTYRAAHIMGAPDVPGGSPWCSWQRLRGFSGGLGDVIDSNFTYYPDVVTIEPSDVGFSTQGCGVWTADPSPITASPVAPFGAGKFIVGTDIAPGTWRNSDSNAGCYWARLSGFNDNVEGGIYTAIDSGYSYSQQIVTIDPSDVGFDSADCGMWTKIG